MIKEFKSINKKMVTGDNFDIFCPDELKYFSFELNDYLENDLKRLKSFFEIKDNDRIMIDLHNDKDLFRDVTPYEIKDFSGFSNNNGVLAYVNINGDMKKTTLKTKIGHELVHHIYSEYVADKVVGRSSWIEEGLAMNLSGDHDYLKDRDEFINFLNNRVLTCTEYPSMNSLKHGKNFVTENYNGYALSYLCVRYMMENYNHNNFLNIIKNGTKSMMEGETVLNNAVSYYTSKYNLNKNAVKM